MHVFAPEVGVSVWFLNVSDAILRYTIFHEVGPHRFCDLATQRTASARRGRQTTLPAATKGLMLRGLECSYEIL